MHGDEYEIISCVDNYVEQHEQELPDFLFIPQVSPSAVAQKTRKNTWGHDVNRNFFASATDPEALALMKFLKDFRFAVCIDFHEDPDRLRGCYLYDSDRFTFEDLTKLRHALLQSGASLYTGIDDPADAHLGWRVRDGYISMPFDSLPRQAGFSGRWFLEQKIVTRTFTVEVPGQAQIALKRRLVAAILETLLPLAAQS